MNLENRIFSDEIFREPGPFGDPDLKSGNIHAVQRMERDLEC